MPHVRPSSANLVSDNASRGPDQRPRGSLQPNLTESTVYVGLHIDAGLHKARVTGVLDRLGDTRSAGQTADGVRGVVRAGISVRIASVAPTFPAPPVPAPPVPAPPVPAPPAPPVPP